MKPKKDILKSIINQSEKFSFGIDYLRIKIDDVKNGIIQHKNMMSKLCDYDNSNYAIKEINGVELTSVKIKLSNGDGFIYNYSFYGIAIPLFIIIEYGSKYKQVFNSWGKIDFYGSYFRLLEIGELPKLYFFNEELKNQEITRVDYRLDFFNYKGGYIDKSIIKARSNTRLQTYNTGGKCNSWKFGNSENKTLLVRGYDKKLDIEKKGKFRLYGDYHKYKNIFRLEWEFLNKFCKGYNLNNLNKLITEKAKSYLGLSENDFKGKLLHTYNKLDLTDEFEKTRYCKLMSSYIRNALQNEINVYDFVDIELEKMGICKKDIEKIKNKSINIKDFNLLNI